MKDYKLLTPAGKIRRLHHLAHDALRQYDLTPRRMSYHCFDTNLLYRVTSAAGDNYILRMAVPGWRRFEDLQSEVMWLDALDAETDISVPRILRAQNGSPVLSLGGNGVPDRWNALLMSYLPGRLLGKYLNQTNLYKMGRLFGRLHVHGAKWKPPSTFNSNVFNHFVSRGEPERLFEDESVEAYTQAQHSQLRRMYDIVESTYANLDTNDIRVIHCDLWHDNIKVHRGELCPFDFEDTILGYRLHDIAMAMLDLLEDCGTDRYLTLLPSFRQGYESILEWPEGNMMALQIGRLLWKINYVSRFESRWLSDMARKHEPIFTAYENEGKLIIDPP